ncbi:MAG: hypothetical protein ACREC9_02325 [Methylocella sp.]
MTEQSKPTEAKSKAGENAKMPQETPREFSKYIYITFFWCMIGVAVIYGIRLYFDIPIHPSFLPIIGAAFAALLAFTVVISIHQVVGQQLKLDAGPIHFEGATGSIIFWCICFLAIVYGLYLLGLSDVIKAEDKQDSRISCSILDIVRDKCPRNLINQKAP